MEKLSADFIDPRLMHNIPITAIVDGEYCITEYQRLKFKNRVYPDKTIGVVRIINGFFYFVSDVEIEEEKKRVEKAVKSQFECEIQEREHRDAVSRKFNMSLNIPVKWRPEIRRVLSGLTENSMGDGMNKRTVTHVFLLEPFSGGRLNRKEGSFLCSKDSGSFSDHIMLYEDSDLKVSCKKCIELCHKHFK